MHRFLFISLALVCLLAGCSAPQTSDPATDESRDGFPRFAGHWLEYHVEILLLSIIQVKDLHIAFLKLCTILIDCGIGLGHPIHK
mgnify:CR=1 FL=1